MKKLIALSALGLVLGLAGAVAIVVVREKQARAAMTSAAADSAAIRSDSAAAPHGGHADSASGTEVRPDSAPAEPPHATDSPHAADSAHAADSLGAGAYASALVAGRDSLVAEVAAATSARGGPDEQRLARIFAAMRPKEAARVLEQMTDPEVRRLLSHLGERQAAAVMSSISPERAAVISSAVIRGERSTP